MIYDTSDAANCFDLGIRSGPNGRQTFIASLKIKSNNHAPPVTDKKIKTSPR
jgi:hypothetical protein